MFYCGSDGIVSCEGRVHDYVKAFCLQIGLVQGFKGAAVIEVMIKRDGKVGVRDSGDKGGMLGGGWE